MLPVTVPVYGLPAQAPIVWSMIIPRFMPAIKSSKEAFPPGTMTLLGRAPVRVPVPIGFLPSLCADSRSNKYSLSTPSSINGVLRQGTPCSSQGPLPTAPQRVPSSISENEGAKISSPSLPAKGLMPLMTALPSMHAMIGFTMSENAAGVKSTSYKPGSMDTFFLPTSKSSLSFAFMLSRSYCKEVIICQSQELSRFFPSTN